MSARYLIICLVALAIEAIIAREISQVPKEGIQTIDAVIDGKQVHFETFDPKMPSVSDARKSIDANLMKDISSLVSDLTRETIVKRKNALFAAAKVSPRLLGTLSSNLGALRKLEKSDPTARLEPSYLSKVVALLRGVMENSKTIAPPQVPREEFAVKVNDLMKVLTEAGKISPVGLYINMESMTIDGVPMSRIGAEYVAYFRKDGYSGVLKLVDLVIGFASKLAPEQKAQAA